MLVDASSEREIRVMALGLDDLTLGRLKATARETELSIHAVSPEAALEHARSAAAPFIVLLEWGEENEAAQTRLCKALRRATPRGRCYIVALGGLSDPSLQRALQSAADDVLTRPFGGEVILRLRQAVHTMESAKARRTPREALDEALESLVGGDVVVRSGDAVGHIHVQGGGVVWANLSSTPATIEAVVRHAGVELDAEVVAAAKQESLATRAHFMDVLVAWGFIDLQRAKEAVRSFVNERVQLVLDLPDASALFLPGARQHTQHLRVSADEIPSMRRPTPARNATPYPAQYLDPRAALPVEAISRVFREALALEGVASVAVLDRRTGVNLLSSGADIDPSVAWSQLSLLAALGERAEDVIASQGERYFIARPLQAAPTVVLFVVLLQSQTTLGLARAMIARLAADTGAAR
jgi:CheY-like chemotaxis protein